MHNLEGKHPGYYEGILQLRNADNKVYNFVRDEIRNNNVRIAKEIGLNEGFDLYLSSNKFLIQLGKKLKSLFSGDLKISKKVYSRHKDTQKDIFRMTVLFRQIKHKAGSIVEVRGERYKINKLGKKVHCTSVEGGRKVFFDYKELI